MKEQRHNNTYVAGARTQFMNKSDVLVIGAGACGLMAARELSKAGEKVIVLEARNRTGGRIHTLRSEGFSAPVEAGAEFVHGELPLTLSLLKEAGISFYQRAGEMYRIENRVVQQADDFIKGFDELLDKLQELESDMSFSEFLHKYFGGNEHRELRESAQAFAEGYDTARIDRLSAHSLRDEWTSEGISNPYFVEGGYGKLVDFLEKECKMNNCEINLGSIVQQVDWEKGYVQVVTLDQNTYTAAKILVTVPPAILLTQAGEKGHIRFTPALPGKQEALKQLGYGSVIKFLLEFKNTFWNNNSFQNQARQLPHLGFLLSKESVPVWWTQLPEHPAMLTGWLGGPKADELKHMDEDQLLKKALAALEVIFNTTEHFLREQLVTSFIANWSCDPFSRGAYSYTTVRSGKAITELKEPVENTIYFAGEALEPGNVGTVEAALVSGKEAAMRMRQELLQ